LRDNYLNSFNAKEREEGRGVGTTIERTNKRGWRGMLEDRERKVKVGEG
jgi:hypothetical protein